jgi:hypothetical protein
MKKIIIFGIIATIVACVLIAGCTNVIPKSPVQVTYYYSQGCNGCTLLDADLAKLEQNYKGDFVVTKYDVNREAVKFKDDLNKYKKDSVTPFVIVGDRTFSGYNESISFYIENMIKNR